MNKVGAYVFTKDTHGRYTFANEMVCQLFNTQLGDLIGMTDEMFFDLSASDELRRNDLLAHRGEEEFILAAPEADINQLHQLAEKIRCSIEIGSFLDSNADITCSIGIAMRKNNESFDDLLKKADNALYLAKNSGRNQVQS